MRQRFLILLFFFLVFLSGQEKAQGQERAGNLYMQKLMTFPYDQGLNEAKTKDATIRSQKKDIDLLDAQNKVKTQWILFGGISLIGIFISILLLRSMNAARRRQFLQEKFSQDLIKTQEGERTRLARELHDSVGQKLMLLTKKTKDEKNSELNLLAESILEEIRNVSRALHPSTVERLGVTGAIRALVNEIDASCNILFMNDIDVVDGYLSEEKALHLFRIVQEVLNNMVRHSKATTASVNLNLKEGKLRVTIKDNGVGFNFLEKYHSGTSLGMKTIMERSKIMKSQINIISNPEFGTIVHLLIPMDNG